MTRSQLVACVASITGESLRTVRSRGFGLVAENADDLEPEDVRLVLDCPFCHAPVPYPGVARDGSLPMAECLGCDVYFPFAIEEVYATAAQNKADRLMPHGLRCPAWVS
jgi:hypothetical protein